jgi:RNA polymerase sigma-70 factor (ECF subfamily)
MTAHAPDTRRARHRRVRRTNKQIASDMSCRQNSPTRLTRAMIDDAVSMPQRGPGMPRDPHPGPVETTDDRTPLQWSAVSMNTIRQPESGTCTAQRESSNASRGGNSPNRSAQASRAAKWHAVEQRCDSELLRALHDEHAHALLSYVTGLTRDRATAQDVVQETMLRAWRNAAVLDQTGGSGRGWLFMVARRIVIDQWRAASRRPEVLTADVPEQAVKDTAPHTVDRQLVQAALRTLSTEHRQALFECYFRGASIAEAAESLGVPPGTVKSRTYYALRALRQAIDGMGGVA